MRKMLERRLYELNLDKNVIRCPNPHQPFQKSFVRINIDEAFVNPHLPLVECVCPCPAGDFRVGTISFFVGRGIGPLSLTPVLSAISLISAHIVLISWGSVLDRRILALETIPRYLHDSTFLAEFTAHPCSVKNVGIF